MESQLLMDVGVVLFLKIISVGLFHSKVYKNKSSVNHKVSYPFQDVAACQIFFRTLVELIHLINY